MKRIGIGYLSALLLAGLTAQAETMWNLDFTKEPNANAGVIATAPSSLLQDGGGQLIINTAGIPGGFVKVYTGSDETGTITQFNGTSLYNFYDHQVVLQLDISSISGRPDGPDNRNVLYCFFGEEDTSDAVFFRLEQLNSGTGDRWRLMYETHVATKATEKIVATFSARPKALSIALKGTEAIIEVEGAVITGSSIPVSGSTAMEWPVDDLSQNIQSYIIAFGAYNIGRPLTPTVVTLEGFRVDVTADQLIMKPQPKASSTPPRVAPVSQSLVLADTFDTDGMTTNALNLNQAARQSGSAAPSRLSTTTTEFSLSSDGEPLFAG